MIAILAAQRAGRLRRALWPRNLFAGVVVGVVALPLSMAFAIASEVKPEQGLYTAIVAGLAVSLFGGSPVQIAGPTGAFIVILAGIVARYGVDGLQLATLMAGVILIGMGLARFGAVIRFIPEPVVLGFTAGIGCIIFIGQWADFLGLQVHAQGHLHQRLATLLLALPGLHPATTLIAALSLFAVVLGPRLPGCRAIPGPLLALLLGTALMAVWQPAGVRTIGSAFGGIPHGLPALHFPAWTLAQVLELIGPAFTIAMLGAIESLLSAVVADGMAGTHHDSNQELLGQGIANLLSPLFGGIAATGAIARTATNIRNGANSPLAGVVHAATLVLILLFLAPLAQQIPLATLSAILFVVAWNMSELPRFARLCRRAPRADVVILWVTFLLTVFADLVVAVNIGVILATLQFLRRMAASVAIEAEGEGGQTEDQSDVGTALPRGVLVYGIEGPMFFAAVEQFQHVLQDIHGDPRVLILRFGWVPFMDATALQALEDTVHNLQRRGIQVILSGVNTRVREKLQRAGLVDLIGAAQMVEDVDSALRLISAGRQSATPAGS